MLFNFSFFYVLKCVELILIDSVVFMIIFKFDGIVKYVNILFL